MPAKRFGLLLAPGAGADSTAPGLVAVEHALPTNFVVRRMDFPYRLAGRKAPDKAPVLIDAVFRELDVFAKSSRLKTNRIFIGGRSMGGRMCSMAAAEGADVAGLVLMSYPLHPPGRPERLRVEHFPQIRVPSLVVSGTRDTFGTPEEFTEHLKQIPGPVTTEWIEGGDHGMRKFNAAVADVVAEWLVLQQSL